MNVPLEISHDESKNVIKVYYVKDSFDYSVEYYYDGVIDNSKTVTGTANFKDVIEAYTDKVIDGYKLDETNPVNVPLEISHDESKNVIKVYYVKDSFGYTVNHIYEGDDSLNYSDSGSALFGSEIGYTAIEKDGYKFDRDDATDGKISISSDSSKNVINVYYVKDSLRLHRQPHL